MKFRTRIWLLPASAAGVFLTGLALALVAGNRTSAQLQLHHDVAAPTVEVLDRIDSGKEKFRLTLQNAASEGDVDGLEATVPMIDATHQSLAALGRIDGQASAAQTLTAAFDAYKGAALAATHALLTEQPAGELIPRMQRLQAAMDKLQQDQTQAAQANQLAGSAARAAERGGSIMGEVVANMVDIEVASRKTGERSAQAAREIKTPIGASGEKVEAGNRLVQSAGEAMNDIVSGVGRVSQIIGEISTASVEQSSGVALVNRSVAPLEQLTQQNAALVEQSAAAAGSLQQQAVSLAGSVAAFRLDTTETDRTSPH